MKVVVKEKFTDKYSKKEYNVGDIVEFENERAKELISHNLIELSTKDADDKKKAKSLDDRETELNDKEQKLNDRETALNSKETELAQKETELTNKEVVLNKKEADLKVLDEKSSSKNPKVSL